MGMGLGLIAATLALSGASPVRAAEAPAAHWPMAILCHVTFEKASPSGVVIGNGVYGRWAYLALAPSGSGRIVYSKGPVEQSEDRQPSPGYKSNVVAVFTADGQPYGEAPGDCAGRSLQSLVSGGQTR